MMHRGIRFALFRFKRHVMALTNSVVWANFCPFGVLSVTVKRRFPLPYSRIPGAKWEVSGNHAVIEDSCLYISSDSVGSNAKGQLFFTWFFYRKVFEYTVVPWKVDHNALSFKKSPGRYTVLACSDSNVLFTTEKNLFKAKSGFEGGYSRLCYLPWEQKYRSDRSLLLKTPCGWFLRTDGGVVRSQDLKHWEVAVDIGVRGMFQHLDYWFEKTNGITYVFAGEYTTDPTRRHGVYRGVYKDDRCLYWSRVYEFFSSEEGNLDSSNRPAARHIHVVTVDKETGYIWVATGDSDTESGIFLSKDLGNSFSAVFSGDQKFRTLMLIFTKKYVYWNMDTHLEDQCIFRIPRDVVADIPAGRASSSNTNYKDVEVVAELPYGAQWYGIKVKNKKNEEQLIMSAGPESQVPETGEKPHRDWNGRIFCVSKLDADEPEVQELAALPPKAGLKGKARRYCRVDPRCQGDDNVIYFMGNNSVYDGCISAAFKR